jgi:tetracycline resistance efflux pump
MRSFNKSRFIFIAGLAALMTMAMPLLALAAEEEETCALYATAWSVLPPLIAIALALITKEVYSSLFIGVVSGAVLYAGFDFAGIVNHTIVDGIIAALSDSYNVGILVFLVILGMFVAMMNKTGGSAAFGRWASEKVKSREGAQFSTILLGMLIFIDDYFNCLTVGSVMRPLSDEYNVSRAKLAYLIDATAAPICIIAPISSWAAAVSGFVEGENGMSVFIRAIPYNFYALFTIVMMFALVTMKFDYSKMAIYEQNAIKHGDLFTVADINAANAKEAQEEANPNGKVIDLLLPVIVLIISCVIFMIYTGGFFDGETFINSFANSDASVGLAFGSMIALLITVIFYLCRRVVSFKDLMDCVPEGFKQMVSPILVLTLAWSLKNMTDSLGLADFVANNMAKMPPSLFAFVPAVFFLVACALGIASGTSWGTFGILIPIALAVTSSHPELMIVVISACMAGGVCGDHCSPISDTTIMASAGAGCNHLSHVETQFPYAMTVTAFAFISYIIAGLMHSPWVAMIVGIALLLLFLTVLKRNRKDEEVLAKDEYPAA